MQTPKFLLPTLTLVAAALLGTLVPATSASAQECAPTERIARHRLLRQLSLDIRGQIPTIEEYEALDDRTGVPTETIREMLSSGNFMRSVREYHRALLWGSLDEVQFLGSVQRRLFYYTRDAADRYYSPTAARHYRTGGGVCLNYRHTTFDENGVPTLPEGRAKDGWVMVAPYWAPDTQVRVCAHEAQVAAAVGTRSCQTSAGNTQKGCGCGPRLDFCTTYQQSNTVRTYRDALVEEPTRIFADIVNSERPYHEAFTTNATFMNGETAHYYRNNLNSRVYFASGMPTNNRGFTNANWQKVERTGNQAGVLTTFGYLMRFASNRARASRFSEAFLCDPFSPSAEGIPESADDHPDLQVREGCEYCHERLEPLAAHWSRWRISQTSGYLDPTAFPAFRPFCATCSADVPNSDPNSCTKQSCNSYYASPGSETDMRSAGVWGRLLPLAWRSPPALAEMPMEERAELINQVESDGGPARLFDVENNAVEAEANLAALASCTSKRLAEHLLGRELTAEETAPEGWHSELAASFEEDYDFKALYSRIVRDGRYRRIR